MKGRRGEGGERGLRDEVTSDIPIIQDPAPCTLHLPTLLK